MNSGKGAKRVRFIHLTDPHLTHLDATTFTAQTGKRKLGYLSWKRKRRTIHLREILDQVTDAIKAEQADQILITGDLVHICLPDEVQQAKAWLQSLGSPEQITLVPGNHDIYQSGCWQNIAADWGDYLGLIGPPDSDLPADSYPMVNEIGNFHLISLSSSEPMPFYSAQGRLGITQIKRLTQMLDTLSGQSTGWLIHHPPLPGLTGNRRALAETAEIKELIEQYQPVFVLYGHNHRNVQTRIHNTRVLGTASASSKYDASYRVIDIFTDESPMQIKMSLHQRTPDSGKFSEIATEYWTGGQVVAAV